MLARCTARASAPAGRPACGRQATGVALRAPRAAPAVSLPAVSLRAPSAELTRPHRQRGCIAAAAPLGATASPIAPDVLRVGQPLTSNAVPIADLDFLAREPQAPSSDTLAVVVSLLSGANLKIETAASSTVRDLKLLLEQRTGLEPDAQRLLLRNKVVQDAERLADFGLQPQERIFMIARLRGG
ncbi:hypothetical protein HYH03_005775 [Edaphochlamys debaryana]|uniref:Ubiquitin-like domain-containing protein n=1 Tax=Edaphochlamys debaryana TaxID=47281 RepID=A0A835YC64_9CHLO|nr:hypothetical protein HYH03_005775 [Edaphochlamys debaryana]|eukprot:KAG2496175.1 hypothetical protein HYH03_005775 [Edaphochlamys debaryana]